MNGYTSSKKRGIAVSRIAKMRFHSQKMRSPSKMCRFSFTDESHS